MDSPNSSSLSSTSMVSLNVYEKLSSIGVQLPDHDKLGLFGGGAAGGVEASSSCLSITSTPRSIRRKLANAAEKECCFGTTLGEARHMCNVVLDDRTPACVPGALVKMITFLEDHMECEGLFRKNGSLTRQKAIRMKLCKGKALSDDTSAHDVANLLKIYFRDLPVCLFLNTLLDSFISVAHDFQGTPVVMKKILLDMCLLLPETHQHALQYAMQFFCKLSEHCDVNLMDLDNLSVVLTPNLMPSTDIACPDLDLRTSVVKVLMVRSRFLGKRRRELAMGNLDRFLSISSLVSEDSASLGSRRKGLKRRTSIRDLGQLALRKGRKTLAESSLKRRRSMSEKKPKTVPELKRARKPGLLSKLLHPET